MKYKLPSRLTTLDLRNTTKIFVYIELFIRWMDKRVIMECRHQKSKPHGGSGEGTPGTHQGQITHVKAFVHTNLNGEDVKAKTSTNPSDVYD